MELRHLHAAGLGGDEPDAKPRVELGEVFNRWVFSSERPLLHIDGAIIRAGKPAVWRSFSDSHVVSDIKDGFISSRLRDAIVPAYPDPRVESLQIAGVIEVQSDQAVRRIAEFHIRAQERPKATGPGANDRRVTARIELLDVQHPRALQAVVDYVVGYAQEVQGTEFELHTHSAELALGMIENGFDARVNIEIPEDVEESLSLYWPQDVPSNDLEANEHWHALCEQAELQAWRNTQWTDEDHFAEWSEDVGRALVAAMRSKDQEAIDGVFFDINLMCESSERLGMNDSHPYLRVVKDAGDEHIDLVVMDAKHQAHSDERVEYVITHKGDLTDLT